MCSINLSGQSLGDDKFLPYVIEQLHRSGIDGDKICFEITETAAIANFSQASRFAASG
jgi:EAL domain-containing protein (putative c-di-GMP-specific phosphodiesterase class I)